MTDQTQTDLPVGVQQAIKFATENERARCLGILRLANLSIDPRLIEAISSGERVHAVAAQLGQQPRSGASKPVQAAATAAGKRPWSAITAKLNAQRQAADQQEVPAQ